MAEATGLAKAIRSATSSEDFDLGNYDQPRLAQLARDAFATPIPAAEMLRFTFTVGGGSKVRQKYDPNVAKHLAAALRELGFEEDSGAGLMLESQGTFKHQHDTDKNLKFMHVYPRVAIEEGAEPAPEALDWKKLPPEYLATVCSLAVLRGLCKAKTPSWSQRKQLLQALKAMAGSFVELEQKMMAMQALTPDEEQLYNSSSVDNLREKVEWLSDDMKAMVDSGQLTEREVGQLREQAAARIEALGADITAAEGAGQAKKVAAKSTQLDTARVRADKLAAIEPIKYPLKHAARMKKIQVELCELRAVENAPKGTFQSLETMQRLGGIPKLEAEVAELAEDAAEWFGGDNAGRLRELATGLTASGKALFSMADKKAAPKKKK